jgi:hypothetical protein
MKKAFLLPLLIFSFILVIAPSKAMATDGWVTIEGWMEEFSFHLPEGYFAYRNKDSGAINLSSYKDKVSINISIATYLQPREYLVGLENRYDQLDCKYDYYTAGQLTGKIFTCDGVTKFYKTLYLVYGSRFYKMTLGADSAKNINISLFLMSLRFHRRPVFPQYGEPVDKNEKNVSEKGLKNDPLVELYEKKPDNDDLKVTYAKSSKASIFDDDSIIYSRDLIIVRKKPKHFINIIKNKPRLTGSAKLRVHFLASGQIDKIEVVSSTNTDFTNEKIDEIRKWKFVPAQIDGKDTDCSKIVEFDS